MPHSSHHLLLTTRGRMQETKKGLVDTVHGKKKFLKVVSTGFFSRLHSSAFAGRLVERLSRSQGGPVIFGSTFPIRTSPVTRFARPICGCGCVVSFDWSVLVNPVQSGNSSVYHEVATLNFYPEIQEHSC